ncbi:hypothetical protein BG011_005160 [Mortierella polycephala]|uniref:Uncharacterized protein n=1 Tax=Mortierella polycephala TaxID=41804 RepID=A0A9P6U1P7_9FUNG|nr:hypothetical protein BG011_005160 [Mortierella polycephala]
MIKARTRKQIKRRTVVRDEEQEAREEANPTVVEDEKSIFICNTAPRKTNSTANPDMSIYALLNDQDPDKEEEMTQEDEREVDAGDDRRCYTGTGDDLASTAMQEQTINHCNRQESNDHEYRSDDEDQSTHTKRSHTGDLRSSATDIVMTSRTKGKLGIAFIREPTLFAISAPDTPTPAKPERTYDRPNYELSSEFWKEVWKFFYPSQLSAPACVNKKWQAQICYLPLWQDICEKANLTLKAKDLEKYGYKRPNYFRIAHENWDMICEQCYKACNPSGSYRALPVQLNEVQAPTEILMCCDCRASYYIVNPEPYPDDVLPRQEGEYRVVPRMSRSEAKDEYLLTDTDIMSLPYEKARNPYFRTNLPLYLFEEQHLLRLSRQVHGGDIGVATARADAEHDGRMASGPHDQAVQNRCNLLRSLLHDEGLHLPDHSAVCHIFIESGLGDPIEIVKEFQAVDWLHWCTDYDPSLNKAQPKQVRCCLRISRTRGALTSRGAVRVAAMNKAVQEETTTEEEEEEEEEEEDHKMAALDDWFAHRFEHGIYRPYKLDPEDPEKPPEGVWPLLDRIDTGHKMLKFAGEKVYRALEKQKHIVRQDDLRKFDMNKNHVRALVDADNVTTAFSSRIGRRKRRKTGESGEVGETEDAPKLSTLLEHDLGSDWHLMVLDMAKKLV